MKNIAIIALLAFVACKKTTVAPSQPVKPQIVSGTHHYYNVFGWITPDNVHSELGDSLCIKVNNQLRVVWNKQDLALHAGGFNIKCHTGDNVSIYENPGLDANNKFKSTGINLTFTDTAAVNPYTYSLGINSCNCLIIHSFQVK